MKRTPVLLLRPLTFLLVALAAAPGCKKPRPGQEAGDQQAEPPADPSFVQVTLLNRCGGEMTVSLAGPAGKIERRLKHLQAEPLRLKRGVYRFMAFGSADAKFTGVTETVQVQRPGQWTLVLERGDPLPKVRRDVQR